MQDRVAAISARAHQLWEESSHTHGQHEQHWHQAEREHDGARARAAAVERFNAEPVEAAPLKAPRKRAAKVAETAAEIPAAPVRKARAPRKSSASAAVN